MPMTWTSLPSSFARPIRSVETGPMPAVCATSAASRGPAATLPCASTIEFGMNM